VIWRGWTPSWIWFRFRGDWASRGPVWGSTTNSTLFHLSASSLFASRASLATLKKGSDFWCRWCDVIPGRTTDSATGPERPGCQRVLHIFQRANLDSNHLLPTMIYMACSPGACALGSRLSSRNEVDILHAANIGTRSGEAHLRRTGTDTWECGRPGVRPGPGGPN
jgi:hypothetical protein